ASCDSSVLLTYSGLSTDLVRINRSYGHSGDDPETTHFHSHPGPEYPIGADHLLHPYRVAGTIAGDDRVPELTKIGIEPEQVGVRREEVPGNLVGRRIGSRAELATQVEETAGRKVHAEVDGIGAVRRRVSELEKLRPDVLSKELEIGSILQQH